MTTGERIKKVRISKLITQEELSAKCNISRSYLGNIELGKYNPSVKTLCKIADALDVPVSRLIGGEDENSGGTFCDIPQAVISKGREFGEVMRAFTEYIEGTYRFFGDRCSDQDRRYCSAMNTTVYAVYLLGVQDGMKNGGTT